MKNAFFAAFWLFSLAARGQSDVLFCERFDSDFIDQMALFPSGDDTTWVNWDEDGKPVFDPALPKNWYWEVFENTFSTGTVIDSVIASVSFLVGGQSGNRNWLILPPLEIPDSTCQLFWRSAPFQGPAYHDGYKVLVSTESNFDYHFIDTLFEQAQMLDFFNDCSVVLDSFIFSEGWIHADSFANPVFFENFSDPTGCSVNLCKLEKHSASLAKFAGQKIYVAFLHDSDDDLLLELDDICVLKNQTSAAKSPLARACFLKADPNPTSRFLTVEMELSRSESIRCVVFDALGREVFSKKIGEKAAGRAAFELDLEGLERGVYFLKMQAGEQAISKTILKI